MTFIFIGIITAVWRACGTIAFIVYYASDFFTPEVMILMTFLMCCLVSVLTGTAFGSAATIGIICMTVANGMGIPMIYSGGAILAGVYFGDRCSPMSTSALLVSELTGMSIYKNIANMIKTSLVPFFAACIIYLLIGWFCKTDDVAVNMKDIFLENYDLSVIVIIPAIVIIVFSLFKINVKITLAVSSAVGLVIAYFIQKIDILTMFNISVFGFHPEDAELASLMQGGGIRSMANVFCIVCISSSYAGIFEGTGFLHNIQEHILKMSDKFTPFGTILITAVLTSMIACNQTLSIMLTHQLCDCAVENKEKLAIYLENSAVVISPLIPWSIASAVTLSSVGASWAGVFTAFYLYLLPIYNLAVELYKRKRKSMV